MRRVLKVMVITLALAAPVCAGDIGAPIALSGDMGQPLAQSSSSEPKKDGNIGQPRAVSDVLIRLLPSLLTLL